MMDDAIGALRGWLSAQSEISTLVSDRVYVNRIPREVIQSQNTRHPQKMLVVRQAGGSSKQDMLPDQDVTANLLCYGETDFEADRVRREALDLLVHLDREVQDGVLLHHVNPMGGPIPNVDPDIVWPAVSQGVTFKASTGGV